MPYQSNDPVSPFTVACVAPGCHAAEFEPCVENGVLLRHTWHRSRQILAQSSTDDLDPADFHVTGIRTIIGTVPPGDLGIFLDDPDDDPTIGRNE